MSSRSAPNPPRRLSGEPSAAAGLSRLEFSYRVVIVLGLTALFALILTLVAYAAHVFLLAFAGVLLAIFLHAPAEWIRRVTGWSQTASLGALLLTVVGAAILGGWQLAPTLAQQFDELGTRLPQAVQQVTKIVSQYEWGRRLLQDRSPAELMETNFDLMARLGGAFSTTLGAVINVLIILFVGIYMAFEWRFYVNGIVRLAPLQHREQTRLTLAAIGHKLQYWLLAKCISSSWIGLATAVALLLWGAPLAIPLALIAAALTFVPNIGPLLASIPIILMGLLQGPWQALYYGLTYGAIETIESAVVTPLAERKTVALPPALTILVQIMMGVLVGVLGVALAAPLTVTALLLIKQIYVGEVLDDPNVTPVEEQVQLEHEEHEEPDGVPDDPAQRELTDDDEAHANLRRGRIAPR